MPAQISLPNPRSSDKRRRRGAVGSGTSSVSTSCFTSSLRSWRLRVFACSIISATVMVVLPAALLHYTLYLAQDAKRPPSKGSVGFLGQCVTKQHAHMF